MCDKQALMIRFTVREPVRGFKTEEIEWKTYHNLLNLERLKRKNVK